MRSMYAILSFGDLLSISESRIMPTHRQTSNLALQNLGARAPSQSVPVALLPFSAPGYLYGQAIQFSTIYRLSANIRHIIGLNRLKMLLSLS